MNLVRPNLLVLSLVIQVQQIKRGDEILVKTDKNLVKELQEGHGEWDEVMVSVSLFVCCCCFLFCFVLFCFNFFVFLDPWSLWKGSERRRQWGFVGFN